VELAAALEKLVGLKGHKSELARLHLDRDAEGPEAFLDCVGSDVRHRPNDIGMGLGGKGLLFLMKRHRMVNGLNVAYCHGGGPVG
jgi:hypothetical protein